MTTRAEKAKVLIVEDEVIIAADLETRLKGLGYAICGKAISADKALDLVKRHHPDLVMMDILLRGEMDGIDAAEIIRDRWGIPVVFLTAYADADRLERAKLAYPFGYLLKPFHDRDLKITTEMALYISRVDAERRKAEVELKKYQELISEINDLAYICDSDGNVIFFNKAFETMTGRKIEEFIGKPFTPLFEADDLEKAMYAYRSTLNGERSQCELQFKDSRIICEYKNIPIRDNNNEIIGVMGIARDITARKLSEEVLRESESRLAALSDASFESIFLSDQGICIDQNLSAEREFDYNREEAVGRPGTDWIIPADRELVRQNMMAGRETPYEVTALRKDGTTFPAEIQGRMLSYQGRRIRVTALRNITERKKTDEALKDSEKKNKQLNILMEDLLKPADLWKKIKLVTDGVVRIFNADFARIWIVKPGDQCDTGCIHAQIPEGPHACLKRDKCLHLVASSGRYIHIDGKLHGRIPFGLNKVGRIASGDTVNFLTNSVAVDPEIHDHNWACNLGLTSFAGYRLLSDDEKPIGVLGLFSKHSISPMDNTLLTGLTNSVAQMIQTAKAEEALRESENRYRTIIDLSPLGFGMVDAQGVILDCNNALASMLGYEINELKGKNFGEITHPDDLKIEQELLSPVWDDEHKSYNMEKRYKHKNGHYFWVNLTATKMQSLSDDTASVFGFIEDITNRKEMELEREKLISELQEALKEIKELRGFFPICSNCKKIRDDEGYWQQIEQYIQERTDAQFSHSICPDCAKKIYPELYQE